MRLLISEFFEVVMHAGLGPNTKVPASAALWPPPGVALPAFRLYGLGDAEGDAEAEDDGEGDDVGEGEAVSDGEADRSVLSSVLSLVLSSVLSGPLEGADVAVVGSVRSIFRGGSYGPLSATESVIATTATTIVTTGVSTITRGIRANGRTHPSKKYHNSTATTNSTPATSHHGCPNMGATYPPNTLLHQDRGSAPS